MFLNGLLKSLVSLLGRVVYSTQRVYQNRLIKG